MDKAHFCQSFKYSPSKVFQAEREAPINTYAVRPAFHCTIYTGPSYEYGEQLLVSKN